MQSIIKLNVLNNDYLPALLRPCEYLNVKDLRKATQFSHTQNTERKIKNYLQFVSSLNLTTKAISKQEKVVKFKTLLTNINSIMNSISLVLLHYR